MYKMRGQAGIEFLLLSVFALSLLIIMVAALSNLTFSRQTQKGYLEMKDLGISIQQELLFASELEDGYRREFYIPDKLSNVDYTISNGNSSSYNGYLVFEYESQEFFLVIPAVVGTIKKQTNVLRKYNNTLYIN